jgi:predicted nucleic acid-binding protein
MRYLLDANACIRYLNGRSESLRQQVTARSPEDIGLCSVVKAELFYGARKSRSPQRSLEKQQQFVNHDAETKGNVTTRSVEEFEIEWIKILAAGESWGVIEAKKNYVTFSQDINTGTRMYDETTRWRVQRFLFIKEDGLWKLDRVLEDVSWSG